MNILIADACNLMTEMLRHKIDHFTFQNLLKFLLWF